MLHPSNNQNSCKDTTCIIYMTAIWTKIEQSSRLNISNGLSWILIITSTHHNRNKQAKIKELRSKNYLEEQWLDCFAWTVPGLHVCIACPQTLTTALSMDGHGVGCCSRVLPRGPGQGCVTGWPTSVGVLWGSEEPKKFWFWGSLQDARNQRNSLINFGNWGAS